MRAVVEVASTMPHLGLLAQVVLAWVVMVPEHTGLLEEMEQMVVGVVEVEALTLVVAQTLLLRAATAATVWSSSRSLTPVLQVFLVVLHPHFQPQSLATKSIQSRQLLTLHKR